MPILLKNGSVSDLAPASCCVALEAPIVLASGVPAGSAVGPILWPAGAVGRIRFSYGPGTLPHRLRIDAILSGFPSKPRTP